jgi:hypothetical protein
VITLAGSSSAGYRDSPGSNALFYRPQSIAISTTGVIYVADYGNGNSRLRSVDTTGSASSLFYRSPKLTASLLSRILSKWLLF